MKSEFDMAVFLSPVLKGAHATRQRRIRQAEKMHRMIRERWGCATPWAWREKHVKWYLNHYLCSQSSASRYYYQLTATLILRRCESRSADYLLNFGKHSSSQNGRSL